jgi:hypothetical protein
MILTFQMYQNIVWMKLMQKAGHTDHCIEQKLGMKRSEFEHYKLQRYSEMKAATTVTTDEWHHYEIKDDSNPMPDHYVVLEWMESEGRWYRAVHSAEVGQLLHDLHNDGHANASAIEAKCKKFRLHIPIPMIELYCECCRECNPLPRMGSFAEYC